jgi:hypothetical protein
MVGRVSDYPIPDEVLVHHAAFLGKTRSGKTSSAKTAVERFVAAGERVCVLDPIKSDWWGMISSADGRAPGLPFQILGGPHGHIPLPPSSGRVIGELVGTGALPLSIIDMVDFPAGGLQQFFCAFAESLMRHQRGVLHLVIEEAHEFAPKERAGIGDENMAIHWAKKLATAGGSKGIRLIVATQRTQALHNAILGSCETLVAHRLTAPADQKPVVDWLKANVEKDLAATIAGGLASLATGSAWVCSGEARLFELVHFPRITTFDNSATPLTDDEALRVQTAAVDVGALRLLVGDAVAEAEANDPKALKAEIAHLRASKGASLAEIEAAERTGHARGLAEGEASVIANIRRALDALEASPIVVQASEKPREAPRPPAVSTQQANPAPTLAQERLGAAGTNGALALVSSAARVWPVKLTWGQVALLAGRKARGGHFNTSRKAALTNGWLVEAGELVCVTEAGMAAAEVEPPNPRPDLADAFALALPQPACKMFSALRTYQPLTSSELANMLGMQPRGGHWNTGMSTLKKNGLIRFDGDKMYLADLT